MLVVLPMMSARQQPDLGDYQHWSQLVPAAAAVIAPPFPPPLWGKLLLLLLLLLLHPLSSLLE